MTRFSIKSLLTIIFLIVLFLAALMQPHSVWSRVIDSLVTVIFFVFVAVAIGSQGKFRVQVISFLVIVFLFHFFVFNSVPMVSRPYAAVWHSMNEVFQTSSPKASSNGKYAVHVESGRYVLYTDGYGTTEEESLVKKLAIPVYQNYTRVTESDFENICRQLCAMLLGFIAFNITGYVYDKRPESSAKET